MQQTHVDGGRHTDRVDGVEHAATSGDGVAGILELAGALEGALDQVSADGCEGGAKADDEALPPAEAISVDEGRQQGHHYGRHEESGGEACQALVRTDGYDALVVLSEEAAGEIGEGIASEDEEEEAQKPHVGLVEEAETDQEDREEVGVEELDERVADAVPRVCEVVLVARHRLDEEDQRAYAKLVCSEKLFCAGANHSLVHEEERYTKRYLKQACAMTQRFMDEFSIR